MDVRLVPYNEAKYFDQLALKNGLYTEDTPVEQRVAALNKMAREAVQDKVYDFGQLKDANALVRLRSAVHDYTTGVYDDMNIFGIFITSFICLVLLVFAIYAIRAYLKRAGLTIGVILTKKFNIMRYLVSIIFFIIGIFLGIAGELIMVAIFSTGLSLLVSSIAVCVSDEIIFIEAFKWSFCCSMIIFSFFFRASIFSWVIVVILFICLLQNPNTNKTKTVQRQASTQNSVSQNIKNTYANNSQKQKVIAQAANLVLMSSQSQLQELYYNSVALGYIEDNPTAFCISVGKYYYRIPSTKKSAPIIKKLYEYCKNDPILIGNMNKYKNAVEVAIVLNNYKALSELGEMIFRKY